MKMARANLISKLRREFYTGLTVGALGLVSVIGYGCGDGPTKPKLPPQTSLSIVPDSGIDSLNSRVRYACTDPDGAEDIAQSYLVVGSDTIRTSSLDSVVTFTKSTSVKGYCRDLDGQASTAGPINVQVLHPSVSQTATRVNDIDIDYSVSFVDLDSATRKILRNDTLIDTRTITGPTYSERLANNLKGQTCFILEANGIRPDTTCATIPDYNPATDISGVQANLNEEDSVSVALPRPTDKNPEDNPVPFISASSLDGKTQVGLRNDSLGIRAIGDSSGTYRIQIQFGSPEGGIATSVLQGIIYDLPRISGNLESNETHTGIQGTVRFYTINGNDTIPLSTRSSDSLKNNITNADGSFSFKITRRTSELENMLVMAREGTPNDYQGYVRTITIPGRDTSGVLIRAVPCAPYCSNMGMFRQFMQELATDLPNTRFDFDGEFIPGFQGFQGIEILGQNPFGIQYGSFTPQQQSLIRDKILDPNDINGLVQNRINQEHIFIGNYGNYTLDSANQRVVPNPGWISFVPYSGLESSGLTETYKVTGSTLVRSAAIYIHPTNSGEGTISHEPEHVFLGTGHPKSMTPGQTVMTDPIIISKTGPADKKAGMVIYEPTFMAFPELEYPHVDYLWNILRTDFK